MSGSYQFERIVQGLEAVTQQTVVADYQFTECLELSKLWASDLGLETAGITGYNLEQFAQIMILIRGYYLPGYTPDITGWTKWERIADSIERIAKDYFGYLDKGAITQQERSAYYMYRIGNLLAPSELLLLGNGEKTATYYPGLIGNGDRRTQHVGHAVRFNGVDEYIDLGSPSELQLTNNIQVEATVIGYTGGAFQLIVGKYDTNKVSWVLELTNTNKFRVLISIDGTDTGPTIKQYNSVPTVSAGDRLKFTFQSNVLKLFQNGVEVPVVKQFDATMITFFNDPTVNHRIGRRTNNSLPFNGELVDIRITDLSTGVYAGYWPLEESSGSTAYDVSGNGNHGTLNTTTGSIATMRLGRQDAFSYPNTYGYTLSGSVLIPAQWQSTTLDASGGALQYSGTNPRDVKFVNANALVVDTTDEITFTSLAGGTTITSTEGTAVLAIDTGNNKLTVTTGGTLWKIILSDGTHLPCEEGKDTTLYDVHANANHGTIVPGTLLITDIRNQKQSTTFYNETEGFRDNSGVLVPAPLVATGKDVLGVNLSNPKNITARIGGCQYDFTNGVASPWTKNVWQDLAETTPYVVPTAHNLGDSFVSNNQFTKEIYDESNNLVAEKIDMIYKYAVTDTQLTTANELTRDARYTPLLDGGGDFVIDGDGQVIHVIEDIA